MTAEFLRSTRALVILIVAFAFGVGTSKASGVYGIISSGDISSANGESDFPTQSWNYSLGGNPEPVTSFSSPVLSGSGSFTFGGSTVSGSATSWATISNAAIHGYAMSNISGTCATCGSETENTGTFNVDWYDTINVGGLPSGTPVDLEITVVLDSAITAPSAQSNASSFLDLGAAQDQVSQVGGDTPGSVIQSTMVDTTSGANLALVAQLSGFAEVVLNQASSETAIVDASDTANFYIMVLTPGASYTSASGLIYAATTPEPASLSLMAGALFAIWVGVQKRREIKPQ
jgi:hypothetical protein